MSDSIKLQLLKAQAISIVSETDKSVENLNFQIKVLSDPSVLYSDYLVLSRRDELVKKRDAWVSVKSEMIDVLQKEISNLENGTRE